MQKAPNLEALTNLRTLNQSFERMLRAENLATASVTLYVGGVRYFADYLEAHGMPTSVERITREHVEAYIVHVVSTRAANTAATAYRSLRRFFGWLVEEGEIARSPMERIRQPTVPETPVPVLSKEQIRRLFKVCEGPDFADRRDLAILKLLADSGLRRQELAGLKVSDVDFTEGIVWVMGKGRRPRAAPFGRKTARTLDRYLRARARHPHADAPELWLGRKGPLGEGSVWRICVDRGREAGIPNFYPHVLRHSVAHHWRQEGGDDDSLMRLLGWRSRAMLHRYGSSAADERARETHRRLGLGDRL
jgi:site-specific recombinase XerD